MFLEKVTLLNLIRKKIVQFAIDLDCQSSTKIQTEIVPFPGSPHESEMKKSTSKASLVPAGGGV